MDRTTCVCLVEQLCCHVLTDTSEDSKLVYRRICTKVDASIFFPFFRRVRATSMTQRRVENTRVHFGTNSPVSVKSLKKASYRPKRLNFNVFFMAKETI